MRRKNSVVWAKRRVGGDKDERTGFWGRPVEKTPTGKKRVEGVHEERCQE